MTEAVRTEGGVSRDGRWRDVSVLKGEPRRNGFCPAVKVTERTDGSGARSYMIGTADPTGNFLPRTFVPDQFLDEYVALLYKARG